MKKKSIFKSKNKKKQATHLIDQLVDIHLNIAGQLVKMFSIENWKLYRLQPLPTPGNISKQQKKRIFQIKNRKKQATHRIDQLVDIHLNIAGQLVEMYSIENWKLYLPPPLPIPGNISKQQKKRIFK